jgi:hypothetical protein
MCTNGSISNFGGSFAHAVCVEFSEAGADRHTPKQQREQAMIHYSKLEVYALVFPQDREGNVPESTDDWRKMSFDHGPNDPEEPGISPEERQRRIDYLDNVWWPQVLGDVRQQHDELVKRGEPSPFSQWVERMKPNEGDVAPAISITSMD